MNNFKIFRENINNPALRKAEDNLSKAFTKLGLAFTNYQNEISFASKVIPVEKNDALRKIIKLTNDSDNKGFAEIRIIQNQILKLLRDSNR